MNISFALSLIILKKEERNRNPAGMIINSTTRRKLDDVKTFNSVKKLEKAGKGGNGGQCVHTRSNLYQRGLGTIHTILLNDQKVDCNCDICSRYGICLIRTSFASAFILSSYTYAYRLWYGPACSHLRSRAKRVAEIDRVVILVKTRHECKFVM